jgi:hypothetical protein
MSNWTIVYITVAALIGIFCIPTEASARVRVGAGGLHRGAIHSGTLHRGGAHRGNIHRGNVSR